MAMFIECNMFYRLWLHMYGTIGAQFSISTRTATSGPLTQLYTTSGFTKYEWMRVEVKLDIDRDFQVSTS